MSNLKRISQATGAFISEDAPEPGFIVNMDDAGAQAFIERIRRERGLPEVEAEPISEPEPLRATEPVAEPAVAPELESEPTPEPTPEPVKRAPARRRRARKQ